MPRAVGEIRMLSGETENCFKLYKAMQHILTSSSDHE